MFKSISIIKKILFSLSLLFCFNLSYAAPSDCMQFASDGEIDCIPAKITYQIGYAAETSKYNTFEDLINTRLTCSFSFSCIVVENNNTTESYSMHFRMQPKMRLFNPGK